MLGGHTGGIGGGAPHMVGGLGGIGPAWTRGEMERPAGEKDMGTWKAAIYTEEQQARLGVTEEGVPMEDEAGKHHLGGTDGIGPAWTWETEAAEMQAEDNASWASLVGQKAEIALQRIKKDMPDVYARRRFESRATHAARIAPHPRLRPANCGRVVQQVPADAMVTMDFDEKRVRLFVDAEGKVVKEPRLG